MVDEDSLAALLAELSLRAVHTMDENEAFVILRCADVRGNALVLKYLHKDSADARRRLRNEAVLTERLSDGRTPPRFLSHRAHGPRFLLTELDSGELLRPERLNDARVSAAVAEALAAFHSIAPESIDPRVLDRQPFTRYYRRGLAKHLLHLVPGCLTLADAAACWRVLEKSLPAISMRQSICHGDFLPTNLLYHRQEETVTITDLEGFMRANHPLFDVVALFTIDGSPLSEWTWQPRFLESYLGAGGGSFIDLKGRDTERAYRGILTFFLAYRLNEARIAVESRQYFDGLGKATYLFRRLRRLPEELLLGYRRPELERPLENRRRNLRLALTDVGFRDHWRRLVAPLSRERGMAPGGEGGEIQEEPARP